MNNAFGQKILGRNFFPDPWDPRLKKKISGTRPGRAAGGPKVVKIVPLGSLTLLKRSGTLKNDIFDTKYYVELFCPAKVMPKAPFLASVGGFWPVLGPAGAETL